ncbi:hypothetical protein CR513_57486, partial [Mucuna pruriens]
MDVKYVFLNEEVYVRQPLGFESDTFPDHNSHFIILQIYVDDIIFGATNENLCEEFSELMYKEFKISMIGELKFFLGHQIKQVEDEIYIH